jgi:hypothetical protein
VPAALEAVCLKAMAVKPEDRYASAQALAADVEHWLADEPVTAWSEPWYVKVGRWVKRHQTFVTASAAAVIVAVVSLSIAAGVLGNANRQLAQANRSLLEAKEDEARAKESAFRREKEAIEQRDLAVENLREAQEQRDRSHFYLESLINMERFGRSLKVRPLRKDFDLRLRLVNGSKGEKTRSMVARGDFDTEQAFYLSVESTADCFLHVFYAIPEYAIERRKTKPVPGKLDPILAVFPNKVEDDNRIPRDTKRLLLHKPALFLSPVVTSGDFAYLYVLATEKNWTFGPDGEHENFYSFSPAASVGLAKRIAAIVAGGAAPGEREKVSEEIVVFHVRGESK